MSTLRYAVVDSRLGHLTLVASDRGLRQVRFDRDRWPAAPKVALDADRVKVDEDTSIARASAEIDAYLAGDLTTWTVPLDLGGVPEFAGQVLQALTRIPHGGLTTYGDLAKQLDRPTASRAVGGACNRNPMPIVIPCHRVVAADGSLGGYAIGLEVKRALLGIERGVAVPVGGWEPAALRRATVTYDPDEAVPTLF